MNRSIFATKSMERTAGERNRRIGFGVVIAAAGIITVGVTRSAHAAAIVEQSALTMAAAIMFSVVAAACSLILGRGWFGADGLMGAARFLVGAFVVSIMTIGLLLTASIVLMNESWANLAIHVLLENWGPLPALWFGALWVCHYYCRLLHIERWSVFKPSSADPTSLSSLSIQSGFGLNE